MFYLVKMNKVKAAKININIKMLSGILIMLTDIHLNYRTDFR